MNFYYSGSQTKPHKSYIELIYQCFKKVTLFNKNSIFIGKTARLAICGELGICLLDTTETSLLSFKIPILQHNPGKINIQNVVF